MIMKNIFRVERLFFSFSQRKSAFFNDSSFSLSKKGLIFVRGKNGIGKSTLLRLLQGVVMPGERLQGSVIIDEHTYDIGSSTDRMLLHDRSIAMAQESAVMIVPSFSGFENLAYACMNGYPDLSLRPVSYEVPPLANLFNIPLDVRAGELSGGQQQMLALLMVTQRPRHILFLDEPTAALDEKNARLVMNFIKELAAEKNMFIFCISHDQALVEEYADSVVQVVENGSAERILECF